MGCRRQGGTASARQVSGGWWDRRSFGSGCRLHGKCCSWISSPGRESPLEDTDGAKCSEGKQLPAKQDEGPRGGAECSGFSELTQLHAGLDWWLGLLPHLAGELCFVLRGVDQDMTVLVECAIWVLGEHGSLTGLKAFVHL